MWWLLTFGALGVVGLVVFVTWLQGRRARRLESERVWEQHRAWMEESRKDAG